MSCSPWLLTLRIEGELSRNLVELLSHELEFERLAVHAFHIAVLLLHHLLHLLPEILTYNIYDLSESGLDSIID